jgi:hypothetical protein
MVTPKVTVEILAIFPVAGNTRGNPVRPGLRWHQNSRGQQVREMILALTHSAWSLAVARRQHEQCGEPKTGAEDGDRVAFQEMHGTVYDVVRLLHYLAGPSRPGFRGRVDLRRGRARHMLLLFQAGGGSEHAVNWSGHGSLLLRAMFAERFLQSQLQVTCRLVRVAIGM